MKDSKIDVGEMLQLEVLNMLTWKVRKKKKSRMMSCSKL